MSDIAQALSQVARWLAPLADESAPAGPDLEYDNDFLALTQAASGRPESQFGGAEPPDWRGVVEKAEELFERTRDLRVAVFWLRGLVHTAGYGALVPGLQLVAGLMQGLWDSVHPQPDPDDNDPYARVNALAVLREGEGLIGDLRGARLSDDRALGALTGRAVELALELAQPVGSESAPGKGPVMQMLEAAVAQDAGLRAQFVQAAELAHAVAALADDKLGGSAPDFKPLLRLADGLLGLLPPEAGAADDEPAAGEAGAARGGAPARGLSGQVSSREEAIRAIDLVCQYLERAEPTNPAALFLRRARNLIGYNFLQLMKVLAPDALSEVARVVGIDPDTVETPDGT